MSERLDTERNSDVAGKFRALLSKRVITIGNLLGAVSAVIVLTRVLQLPTSWVTVLMSIFAVTVLFTILEFSLNGTIAQFINTILTIRKHELDVLIEWSSSTLKKHDPETVSEYEPETLEKHTASRLEVFDSDTLNEVEPTTLETIQRLGVEACYPKLSEAGYDPEGCTDRVNNRLWFRGVTGSHWFDANERVSELERVVDDLGHNSDEIRFLILDPRGDAFDALNTIPPDNVGKHYREYEKLAGEYTDLNIRLYDYLPHFRLTFINKDELIVSHYNNSDVMGNPCIRIENTAEHTLYQPFVKMFNRTWENDTHGRMYQDGELQDLLKSPDSTPSTETDNRIYVKEEFLGVTEDKQVYLNENFLKSLQAIGNVPGEMTHSGSIDILEADIDYSSLE